MPYAPGINYDPSPLAAGIAQFGENLKKFGEKRKQENQEAATLRKLLPIYAPELKDTVGTMGLKDLRAEAESRVLKRAMANEERAAQFKQAEVDNQKADNQRANAFLKIQQDQQAARQRQQEALAGFARSYGQPAVPGVSSPGVLQAAQNPAERLRRALAANPEAMSPELLGMIERATPEAKPPPRLVEQKIGNSVFAVAPTGAFQKLDNGEITPLEKQKVIARLRSERRGLIEAMARSYNEEATAAAKAELATLDEELAALGVKTGAAPADDDAQAREALGRAKTEKQRKAIRELYKQRTGRNLE